MAGKNYIDFSCLVQALERTDSNTVAADAVGTVIARFDLCEAWAGLTIYARFEHANIATPFDVKLDTDSCAVVPWEVLQPFGFHVSLFGDDANGERLTAAAVFVDVENTVSLAEHEPIPSTPTLLQQLEQSIAQATEVAQSVRNDADAGVFDGNVVEFGSITATVGENVGTPSVEVYVSGTSTVKDVEFAFDGIKGNEFPAGGEAGQPLLKAQNGYVWGVIGINGGGTGANDADAARANLGAAPEQHTHSAEDIVTGLFSTDVMPVMTVAKGGTGAEDAATARANLDITLTNLGVNATAEELNYCDGLTSNIQEQINGKAASSHNHSAANITSGTLALARGGTGANDADAALTNLGVKDYVVARGTSGNWVWEKYNSGVAKCWAVYTKSVLGASNTIFGMSCYSFEETLSLPFKFIEKPVFVPAVKVDSNWGVNVRPVSSATSVYIQFAGESGGSKSCDFYFYVVGKWK